MAGASCDARTHDALSNLRSHHVTTGRRRGNIITFGALSRPGIRMATHKIRCSVCGFEALLVSREGRDKLTVDSVKQVQMCGYFKEQAQTDAWKIVPLDCPHLQEQIQRPRGPQ
jgi:hypothetical protein